MWMASLSVCMCRGFVPAVVLERDALMLLCPSGPCTRWDFTSPGLQRFAAVWFLPLKAATLN